MFFYGYFGFPLNTDRIYPPSLKLRRGRQDLFQLLLLFITRDAGGFIVMSLDTRFHDILTAKFTGYGIHDPGRFRFGNGYGCHREDAVIGSQKDPLGKFVSVFPQIVRNALPVEMHADTLAC